MKDLATEPKVEAQFWNIREVCKALNVSSYAIRTWVRLGKFPKPLKFSPRCSRWNRDEVLAFVKSLSDGRTT
jgi:prophage regulatory protein